jgi:hypothetical protein
MVPMYDETYRFTAAPEATSPLRGTFENRILNQE